MKRAATAAKTPIKQLKQLNKPEISSQITAVYLLTMAPVGNCAEGGGSSQREGENSASLSHTPKPQQQKGEKQQNAAESTDAEWHTLIDRLNELTGDLQRLKEKDNMEMSCRT